MKLSYSQNLEDIILWRVLGDVKNGVYVDVGANSPSIDSVTKLFYDAGWRGVNIEPITESYDELCKHRAEDTNFKMCATDADDRVVKMLNVQSTGLSTALIGNKHEFQKQGYAYEEVDVPGNTLSTIWREAQLEEVHFLKIDVEGMESEVVAGLDLNLHRPWVILIESIDAVTKQPNHMQWESCLLENDYEFVYFDGLNRFYIAKEKSELKSRILNPPNIIDDRILENILHVSRFAYPEQVKQDKANQILIQDLYAKVAVQNKEIIEFSEHLTNIDTENKRLQERVLDFEKFNAELNLEVSRLHEVERAFVAVLNSRFWRYTRVFRSGSSAVAGGLRKLKKLVHFVRAHGVFHTIRITKQRLSGAALNTNDQSSYACLTEGEKEVLKRLTRH